MTLLLQKAIKALSNLEQLPEDEQNAIASRVINVLEFSQNQEQPIQKRTPGLEMGTIQISDDFDDPLPDSFWLGEE